MANPEHRQILLQGVAAWNQWREQNEDIRPELSRAYLSRASLRGANLFWADLRMADLRGANLQGANLQGANLQGAALWDATLAEADLSWADLRRANLWDVNLSYGTLFETVFSDIALTAVHGLETCHHNGPSILDHRTLARSGSLPLAFLRGCGLSDWAIEATKLYQPDLTPTQIHDIVSRIDGLRADPLRKFYSCFISHSTRNKSFVRWLHDQLQPRGIRCWLAERDLVVGRKIIDELDRAIGMNDKLLLCCSEAALTSTWVEDEISMAIRRERHQGGMMLVPLLLDDYLFSGWTSGYSARIQERLAADFRGWTLRGKGARRYQVQLERLIASLQREERVSGTVSP